AERPIELDVGALDPGKRRAEVRIVGAADGQHSVAEIQEAVPDVGIQTPALQDFDEIDEPERNVERKAAAAVEQLAEMCVAGQRALAARALEHPVVLEERLLLEVNVRLQVPVDGVAAHPGTGVLLTGHERVSIALELPGTIPRRLLEVGPFDVA